jgi:hypothetical protein
VDLPPDFKELLAEFAHGEVEVVLIGGYAVAYHGRPRATKDIDLVLEGSPANLERAAEALARFGAPGVVVEGVRKQAPTDVVYMDGPRSGSTCCGRSMAWIRSRSSHAQSAPTAVPVAQETPGP